MWAATPFQFQSTAFIAAPRRYSQTTTAEDNRAAGIQDRTGGRMPPF
jgi:hypothetical protein